MQRTLTFLLLIILFNIPAKSQDIYSSQDTIKSNTVIIPFAFYLKTFGLAGAVNISNRNFLQEQATSTLVGIVSTNGTKYIYWDSENIQIPYIPRLFLSPNINIASYGALDLYNGPNPEFPNETAGNNSSSKNNYYRIKSQKQEIELLFRYLLPIGYGKQHIINKMELKHGIPIIGKSSLNKGWNPFTNGRTFIESSLFYQNQDIDFPFGEINKQYAGYNIGLNCENIDFKDNPSKGVHFYYKYWKSLKISNKTIPWTMHEISISKYFSIPTTFFRQQVIAMNAWSRNTASWNNFHIENERKIYHRPSPSAGANLGGRYHFRGFPEARFNYASSILYSFEYRIIPKWNPFKNWNLLKKMNINIDWIQFVAFMERGRVGPKWNFKTLHSNMKHDYGVGFRMLANQMIIRVDAGFSNEEPQIQMFIGQAF